VRVVHTIVFDGDQEKDFVRGLGLQIAVPMREEARNRTVRFAGADGGLWSEPLQPGGGSAAQESGEAFPGGGVFAQNAIWDDFKLLQPNPDGFTIVKRTNPGSTWLFSAAGGRAPGLAYVGGHAWDNTELGAPLWLWYSYLRTGRADLFRLAEAHTRNTSETDVYHLGDMKGLGTRHNVVKWGDAAKEARVSQAAHWRFLYCLTTDERTGDIMRESAESADLAVARFDPMREAAPRTPEEPVVRLRIGPDWYALAGDWMTEWERTGDTRWRDRILTGVDSIMAMPYWLLTGKPNPNGGGAGEAVVGYDLATKKLFPITDPVTKATVPVSYNLATIQGGAQVMFELVPLLGRKDFETAWLQICRIGAATPQILTRDKTTGAEGADASLTYTGQSGPRLAAYAYAKTKIPAFAQKAIAGMLGQGGGIAAPHRVSGPDSLNPVEEDARISTNEAAQTGLSIIEILELCKDLLPTEAAVRPARGPRGGSAPAPRGN